MLYKKVFLTFGRLWILCKNVCLVDFASKTFDRIYLYFNVFYIDLWNRFSNLI